MPAGGQASPSPVSSSASSRSRSGSTRLGVLQDTGSTAEEQYSVVLHDDDWHTYDEVEGALVRLGMPRVKAGQVTMNVDQVGDVVVVTGALSSRAVQESIRVLSMDTRLVTSVESVHVRQLVANAGYMCEWLAQLS